MTLAPRLARSLATGLASLALLAGAASAQVAPLEIDIDKPVLEAGGGDMVTLTIRGEPGHYVIMVLGGRRGATPLADVGIVEIATDPTPALFCLGFMPPSGEMSLSCCFGCADPLTDAGPLFVQVVTVDTAAVRFDQISNLAVFELVSGDCGMCVDEAPVDSFAQYSGGHAFWLPGIGTDFVFASGGQLSERGDGTARLVGVIERASDSSQAFAVDVLLSGRISATAPNHPPVGSPKLELQSGAYYANGGSVDPSNWHYFEATDGILMGLGCYEGAVVSITERGPAFQVGYGANGKNVGPGGSGWIEWLVLEQPVGCSSLQSAGNGDINIDAGGECADCVEEAGDHAITLKAFGDDFLFESGGELVESADGTARLSGVLRNDVDALNRWEVELVFGEKMMPGNPSYPPAGSPKQELASSAYVENGGVVDPGTWIYYRSVVGHMTGLDDNLGLELELARRGPAFQLGVGANGKNLELGASGWLDVVLTANGSTSVGDINVDMGDCD